MSPSAFNQPHETRPDFMVQLGLLPPYTPEDVKQAYLIKAKQVHPDHGGTAAEFRALQEAFEKAQQYTEFRCDRRGWIAAKMQGYLSVRAVMERLEAFGAEVTTNAIDWLQKSFGDFSQLTETITAVRLVDSPAADAMIRYMVKERPALGELTRLELPGCQVSDKAVLQLEAFQQLRHLDLTGTPVTKDALWIVEGILGLESLELQGTRVAWWMRRKVRAVLRKRREARPVTPFG